MEKVVIILRGTSESGKTTFADYLEEIHNASVFNEHLTEKEAYSVVCCADDYFTDQYGNYNFRKEELGDAHKQCRERFDRALKGKVGLIIVSNTNSTSEEFSYYLENAQNVGYKVFSLVVEKRNDKKNHHHVSIKTKNRQATNIKNSLRLL